MQQRLMQERLNRGMNNNNNAAQPAPGQPGMPGVGGAGVNNVPPDAVPQRTSQQIQAGFPEALLAVQNAINGLSQPNQQAVTTKLNAAQKQLQHFSQDNIVKQLEELAKNLKASIKELIKDEEHKNAVIAKLHALFELYQEFARARLNEIREADPSNKENLDFIASRGFVTPDGQPLENLNDLGTKHGYIKGTNPNALIWKEVLVEFKNGKYSSNSPDDLARVVKMRGCSKFTFHQASSGRQLRLAVRAMLKVGIKDVSISPELSGYLYRTMRNPLEHVRLHQLERICNASRSASQDMGTNDIFKGDTADPYRGANTLIEHEVATFQRLSDPKDQLAYLQILYPEDTARKYAEFTSKLEQVVRTDPDTQEKIPLLKDARRYFREKLLNRGAMISRGLPSFPRQKLKNDYELELLKVDFDKDKKPTPAKNFNKRQKTFLNETDAKVLNRYAESEKLTPANIHTLITAAYNHFQTGGAHAISLKTSSVTGKPYVDSADEAAFLKKTLPLFKRLQTDAENAAKKAADHAQQLTEALKKEVKANQIAANAAAGTPAAAAAQQMAAKATQDVALLRAKSTAADQANTDASPRLLDALTALRDQCENAYNPPVRAVPAPEGHPAPAGISHPGDALADVNIRRQATEDFHKNKLLLDKLEEKIFTDPAQLDAHHNQTIQNYTNIANAAEKGAYYITHLSSAAQAKLCGQTDAAGLHTLTMDQRAMILQLMIQNFAKVNLSSAVNLANVASSTALFFGEKEIAPLLADLSADEMKALTKALRTRCLNSNIFGCDQDQNLALDALRQIINANGPEAVANPLRKLPIFNRQYKNQPDNDAAKRLSTVKLFAKRYERHPDNNELLDRIQCYAQARSQQPSLEGIAKVDSKFALEMDALLPRDNSNFNLDLDAIIDPDLDALLDHIENHRGAAPERNTPHMLKLIGDIRNLRRPHNQNNGHDFDDLGENEFEMHDMALPGLVAVNN